MKAAFIVVALSLAFSPRVAEGAKKYVLFGWEFSQLKIRELQEKAPWFDTLAVDGVGFAPLSGDKDLEGRPMWSRYLMHTGPWRHEDVAHLAPQLRKLTAHRSMKECFFKSFCAPTNRIDWTDDAQWSRIAQNMAVLARLARNGGIRGLGIDHEDYFRQEQFRRRSSDPGYDELEKLVRRRAREVFGGVFREYPAVRLITFWLLSQEPIYFGEGDIAALKRDRGDLWPAFVNGIFDVMPPTALFIDGDEKSYRYRADNGDFDRAYVQQRTRAIRLIESENRGKYRAQASMAFSVYLDMYLAKEGETWYMPPLDGSRLKRFKSNLSGATYASDEYVWFWGQEHCWAKWPPQRRFNGYFRQEDFKRTWDECMNGLYDAVAEVKDPTGYGMRLWDEARSRGGLKPLNANGECRADGRAGLPRPYAKWQDTYRRDTNGVFKLDTSFGEGDSSSICVTGVSNGTVMLPVKGVKSGEWYAVEFSAFGEGVSANVGWYSCGKWFHKASSVAVVFDGPETPGRWRRSRGVFKIPDGADGFCLIMGAHLMPGESCWFDNIRAYKLKEKSQ